MNGPRYPAWQRRLTVLAPPGIIVVFVLVLLGAMLQRAESTRRVQATYGLIATLHELGVRMVDAETGQRGYLITGDTAYLQPYQNARADANAALDSIGRTFARDSEQAPLFAELRDLVHQRLTILDLPIAARARGFAAAREQLIAGRGKEIMDRIRTAADRLETIEVNRLELQRQAQARSGLISILILSIGAVASILVALLTYRMQHHYARALERVNSDLRDANEKLQDQALELEMQSQELHVQNEQLEEDAVHLEAANQELEETAMELESTNQELEVQRTQLEQLTVELHASNADLHHLNRLLQERTEQAEAANRAKTHFLTSMSHELRTPLNAIGGYIDLLDMGIPGPVTPKQRQSLDRIKHNANHLLVLINDVLAFAKLQAGRVEVRRQHVTVESLLAQTMALIQPLLDAKHITIVKQGELPPVTVHADPDRTRQILLNLLSNAVKHTERGGEVQLAGDIDEAVIRLRIRDSGVGIPEELQEAIFDPFVQVQRSDGALSEGVGLGLSISRELARAMGGEVSVTSRPGHGATFTLSLPRAASPVPAGLPDDPESDVGLIA